MIEKELSVWQAVLSKTYFFLRLLFSCGGNIFFNNKVCKNVRYQKRELEYLFVLSRETRILFPEFNIRLYDKNSQSDFLFSTKIRIFFLATLGIRIFL